MAYSDGITVRPLVRERAILKSPVLENCTPGSVRGASGNRRSYLDRKEKVLLESHVWRAPSL